MVIFVHSREDSVDKLAAASIYLSHFLRLARTNLDYLVGWSISLIRTAYEAL
jgi:hypothetical protein